jgi:hypothetical protein
MFRVTFSLLAKFFQKGKRLLISFQITRIPCSNPQMFFFARFLYMVQIGKDV